MIASKTSSEVNKDTKRITKKEEIKITAFYPYRKS